MDMGIPPKGRHGSRTVKTSRLEHWFHPGAAKPVLDLSAVGRHRCVIAGENHRHPFQGDDGG